MNLKHHATACILASMGAAACLFTACTDEIATIDKNEEYTRAFVKEFGIFDTTHDWNIATRAGVDVSTEKPSDIRVTATIGDKQYLLAHYKGVSGSRHIAFDIPKGIDRVRVSDDFHSYEVALGAKVDFAGSGRAIWEGGDSKVTITRAPYRFLTEEGVMAFKNYLPEDQDNLGKVVQNFTFISNGDFTVYPTYWQTDSYNTIGIYYIDEEANEMVHIPFYSNKISPIDGTQGNLLYTYGDPDAEDKVPAKGNIPLRDPQNPMDAALLLAGSQLNPADFNNNGLTDFTQFSAEDWRIFKRRFLLKVREVNKYYFNLAGQNGVNTYFDIDYFINSDAYKAQDAIDNAAFKLFQITDMLYEVKDATHINITAIAVGPINDWIYPGENRESHPSSSNGQEVRGWRSRGVHIDIAPGTKFGMYLRVWYYSDPVDKKPSIDNVDVVRLKIGEDGMPISDGYRRFYSEAHYNPEIVGSDVFAATYMYEAPTGTYRVLGFEDYGSPHDLNDMMFFISSDIPADIPDVEDIDHPKMSWILAVEDLGSTDDFDFNDLVLKIEHVSGETTATVTPLAAGGTLPMRMFYNDQEISGSGNYAHVNQFFGVHDHTVMLNTGRATGTAESVTIEVPEDFSMANLQGVIDSKMGGFHIKVKQSDEGVEGNWTDDVIDITAAEAGAVPQILCVPGSWQWPLERISIKQAYPEVGEWILNKENNTDWYLHPVPSIVWKR
ncbi:MAG: DUF4842 domain-containing protein [Muribaculaceae bacterium]|nr:DUF4842 domain-containing protein [Muribaculaceae bacterium]